MFWTRTPIGTQLVSSTTSTIGMTLRTTVPRSSAFAAEDSFSRETSQASTASRNQSVRRPPTEPCAIFAKSPITRCMLSNVDPPDVTTPCMAETTFFI
jgi:hypothetical protein